MKTKVDILLSKLTLLGEQDMIRFSDESVVVGKRYNSTITDKLWYEANNVTVYHMENNKIIRNKYRELVYSIHEEVGVGILDDTIAILNSNLKEINKLNMREEFKIDDMTKAFISVRTQEKCSLYTYNQNGLRHIENGYNYCIGSGNYAILCYNDSIRIINIYDRSVKITHLREYYPLYSAEFICDDGIILGAMAVKDEDEDENEDEDNFNFHNAYDYDMDTYIILDAANPGEKLRVFTDEVHVISNKEKVEKYRMLKEYIEMGNISFKVDMESMAGAYELGKIKEK